MMEALYLALMGVGAMGVGRAATRRLGCVGDHGLEKLTFAVAAGLGVLMTLLLALGLGHLLHVPVVVGVVSLWVLAGLWELVRRPPHLSVPTTVLTNLVRRPEPWLVAAVAVGHIMGFLRALAPPHGSTDPLAYQLALPKLFLTTHGLGFEATVTGALYPSNMGLLYAAAIAVRSGSLAQIVHWSMGVLTCVAIAGFARRYYSLQAGVWAAAIFSLVPAVVVFGPLGYIDLGLCFFQVVAFWALVNHMSAPGESRWLVAAGVLAGIAMGIKHQGLATLAVGVVLLAVDAIRRRDLRGARDVAQFAALALAMAAPWYARSMVHTGNPIWPLASGLFGDPSFRAPPQILSGSIEAGRGLLGGLIPPPEWWVQYADAMALWQWTIEPSGWQKAIGPHFLALLPGVLLLWRCRRVRLLLGGCVVYHAVLIRALHMNPRYGLVLFAYLSVLCGLVAERFWEHRYAAVRAVFGLAMAASLVLGLSWSYHQCASLWPVASGKISDATFLQQSEPGYRVFQAANRSLPPDAVVLLQGIVKGYYCDRRYLWDHPHQGVVDYAGNPTPEDLLAHLGDLGVTHIIRMIRIPQGRLSLGYPQYFTNAYHEAFRHRYLKLLYRDEGYAMFEVVYPAGS